jgi:DNA polymerase elongation subunit (family B)
MGTLIKKKRKAIDIEYETDDILLQHEIDKYKKQIETFKKYTFEDYKICNIRPPKERSIEIYEDDINFFFISADYGVKKGHGLVITVNGISRIPKKIHRDYHVTDTEIEYVDVVTKVQIKGFNANFYILNSNLGFNESSIQDFIGDLDQALAKYPFTYWDKKSFEELDDYSTYIVSYSFIKGKELMGYKGGDIEEFIKIEVAHPRMVPALRKILEHPQGIEIEEYIEEGSKRKRSEPKITPEWDYANYGIQCDRKKSNIRVFEADVDFILRYLTDHLYEPSTWFRINRGEYKLEIDDESQIKLLVEDKNFYPDYNPNSKKITPLLITLSIDCEMQTNGKRFPEASKDPILQIGNCMSRSDKPGEYFPILLAVKHVDPRKDCPVFTYKDDKDMIIGFKNMVHAIKPDRIIGYNSNGFDIPYLIDRSTQLKIYDFPYLGRDITKRTITKTRYDANKKIFKASVSIDGTLVLDVMRRLQETDKSLTSYKLGHVSDIILSKKGEKKVTKEEFDVFLLEKFQKTQKGRERIVTYVLKDAYLPLRIDEKRKWMETFIETSRIAKVPIQLCIDRAQGIKIEGRLLQECTGLNHQEEYDYKHERINKKKRKLNNPIEEIPEECRISKRKRIKEKYVGFLKECKEKRQKSEGKYKGATVIEPVVGFYGNEPVWVFDFSSMYPSILIFLNLCFTTLVSNDEIKKRGLIRGKDYIKIFTGKFLPKHQDQDIFYNDYKETEEDADLPCFIIKDVLAGILPTVEKELFTERKSVRYQGALANAENKLLDEIFLKIKKGEKPTKELLERWIKDFDNILKNKKEKKEQTKLLIQELNNWNGDQNDPELIKHKEIATSHYGDLSSEFKLLDANQIAIKEWMNSIYGICGDSTSKFECKPIATTITSTGRWLLELVKIIVETQFCKKNGYPFDAKVIYGDTDSVFVLGLGFPICPAASFSYGKIIGDFINAKLKKYAPMEINFEKFYTQYNLVTAKCYCGLEWAPFSEESSNVAQIKVKGMKYKKGDTIRLAKEIAEESVRIIAKEGDLKKAIEYVKKMIQKVKDRQVHLGGLIFKKKLGKELLKYGTKERKDPITGEITYAKVALAPSVSLAIRGIVKDELKMLVENLKPCFTTKEKEEMIHVFHDKEEARYKIVIHGHQLMDPKNVIEGNILKKPIKEGKKTIYFVSEHDLLKRCKQPPHASDFINYVLIETDERTSKKSDFCEDPLKVLKENIPYNIKAYVDAIIQTVMRVFSGPLGYDRKEGTPQHKKLIPKLDPHKPDKVGWQLSTDQKKEITKLFLGVDTVKKMVLKNEILETSSMFKYVIKGEKCILCKLPLTPANKQYNVEEKIQNNVCKHCYQCLPELHTKEVQKLEGLEKECKDSWDICRTCLATNEMEELLDCTAIECENFSRRDFVNKNLKKQQDKIDKITINF